MSWDRTKGSCTRRASNLKFPTVAIVMLNVSIRLRTIRRAQFLGIPFQLLGDAIGHIAELHCFRQRAAVIEIARRWTASLASLNPFFMVSDGIGNEGGWRHETGKIFF